jgi:hypothetical protein
MTVFEKAMRVLISTSTFPVFPDDGLPRFVSDLAQALSARCEVTVLAPDAPLAEQQGSVEVRRFTYFHPRRWQRLAYGPGMRENMRASLLARFQVMPFLRAETRATRRLVREKSIDVVNSHWMVPQGLAAAWARGRKRRFAQVQAADVS